MTFTDTEINDLMVLLPGTYSYYAIQQGLGHGSCTVALGTLTCNLMPFIFKNYYLTPLFKFRDN